jgi:hypothetical protein
MRYDGKVSELVYTTVDNGVGGTAKTWAESGVVIDALVAPVSADIQLRTYGFAANKVVKVITAAEISDKKRYKIDGEVYLVRQIKKHKHSRNFMLLEAV